MKRKLLILSALLTLSLAHSLTAQEVVDLKLLTNEKDSTYRFCEITTKDGDTIGIRFFPQAALKQAEFITYATAVVNSEVGRRQELARLQKMSQKNIDYLSAQIDTVGGPGTFADQQHEKLKAAMQGAWTLVVRDDGAAKAGRAAKEEAEADIITVVISGDTFGTKDKQSAITWTNGETFTVGKGVFAFNLNFKQVEPDRYVAEKNVDKVLTKFVLKR